MTAGRTSVAVVRGEALNPFEMQAYRPLGDTHDVLLVGRRRPPYEVDRLGLPVTLLHAPGERRVTAALARRTARALPRTGPERLLGLARAVAGRDVLHGAETAVPSSEQLVEIAARTGATVVLTCWENIPFRFEEDATTARRKAAVRDACDRFVAVTPSARDALLAEGVDAARIAVVPAAVDLDRFAPTVAPAALPGVPDGALVVLFVGRVIQEKGVVELVRAVAELPAVAGRAVHLVLAGDGPDGPRALAAARALGAADRVHRHAGVGYSAVPSLMAAADVVVAPSLPTPYWQEQFGMVLVEAMACGRALLTTRSGSIPEVVGDAAELVTPYDVRALTGALRGLLADPDRRSRLGTVARRRAEEHYAAPLVADVLRAVYREARGR